MFTNPRNRNARASAACHRTLSPGTAACAMDRQSAERSEPVWIPEARQAPPAPDGKYPFGAAGLKALP